MNFDARVYGPQRIAAVVATLAEDGVAPALTLADSGIDEDALRASATRVSYGQVVAVFRNAVRLATDPATALRAGARMHITSYGMYGYGLLSSPTRAALVEFSLKYNRVMGPVAGAVAYERDGDVANYTFEVMLSTDPEDALYRFALEFALAAHLRLGRDLLGPDFMLWGLRARYAEPPHVALYRDLFDGPLRFGEDSDRLQVAAPWIDRSSRLPDAVTHAMVTQMCQQVLAELPQGDGTGALIRRTLIEQMPWRFPTIDSMARQLAMHPRALRRRLEAEGTSYRDLLAAVRRGLAIEYLRKTRMTTEDIASRLGYSDAANFRHAFVRWTGSSPTSFRPR
ncbi:AraC family transcriptional regulator [Variovorax sp. CY25R-8]|uniref:AraC family transcriptional regulator n=1 Tax=Variovorax sp. CY25R-8 TaxID=2855501 RepID=UPI0021BB64DA|nr:AraC family transcriptional regulator [Variovorax sp. CY25R-8]MCT8178878.1 AraC family transcriptional regulator [Variovorax sp. CY25R-8]